MHLLKKAKSASAVVSNISYSQPDKATDADQHEHPDRNLMYLVFADGTTATIQTQSSDN